jgi:hypothetical protein
MAAMFGMVTQEGAPGLGGRPRSLDHVFRDARLSDFKAELEQLTMDTRGAPQRIVNAHLPDQGAQVRVDLRTASKRVGSAESTVSMAIIKLACSC